MILETIIIHYRNRLASLPDAILIGEIPKGAESIPQKVSQYIAPVHSAFLKLCNGGGFWRYHSVERRGAVGKPISCPCRFKQN